ncbi:hypothetical protein ACFL59_10585, partial [Planctomycetota bacterium]
MKWAAGETMLTVDPRTKDLDPVLLPDEVEYDIDRFNTLVLTDNFNRVVCRELARHIDPSLDEKTLIFSARDSHADTVVRLLKEALGSA